MNMRSNKTKTRLSRLSLALLLLVVMLAVAGCGKSADASDYVKSFMDMLTKGEVEKYKELSGRSQEEVMEEYNSFSDSISQIIGAYGCSEEVQNRFTEVFKDVYAKSKYEVGEEKKTGNDEYEVDVTIEPIVGLFDGIADEIQEEAADYGNQMASDGGSLDQNDLMDWIFNTVLDKMEERMDSIEYGEPETITVKLKKKDGRYEIEDKEKIGQQIGMTLIDTTGLLQ